jgi:hypothetical protein
MVVSDRGRLPARVVEAYAAAHGAPEAVAPAEQVTRQPRGSVAILPEPEPEPAIEPDPVAAEVDPEPAPAPTFEGVAPAKEPTRRGRPRWLLPALAALAALTLLGAVLFLVLRDDDETPAGTVTFDDVQLGDCTGEIPEGVTLTVVVLPCDEPHEGEVYATFELSGDDYPGAEQVERFALGGCRSEAVAALPPDDETLYDLVYLAPSQQTWENGDRTVSCVLSDPDGEPLVGSVLQGTRQR